MIDEVHKLTGRVSSAFKKRYYGSTFRCPVCHLELAHADVDHRGLVVCPLCGVVMHVERVYGHTVPVVNDLELLRPQPKARLHPLAAHLPIGLYPLAVVSACVLIATSVLDAMRSSLPAGWSALVGPMSSLADATLLLLLVSVVFAVWTLASGIWDWKHRYRGRPYRIISLKILFSILFVVLGGGATVLHATGLVFSATTGLVDLGSPAQLAAATIYLVLLLANLVIVATLGHVGGNLVHGR